MYVCSVGVKTTQTITTKFATNTSTRPIYIYIYMHEDDFFRPSPFQPSKIPKIRLKFFIKTPPSVLIKFGSDIVFINMVNLVLNAFL